MGHITVSVLLRMGHISERHRMQGSIRSYLTSGVALAGASAIALTPVAIPDTYTHTNPFRAAAVELTATQLDNPIEVFRPAFDSFMKQANAIGAGVLGNPAPVLTALLLNQVDDAKTLAAVGDTAGKILGTAASKLPQLLQTAAEQLQKGQLSNAYQTLFMAVLQPVVTLMIPSMTALVPMITQPFARTKLAIEAGITTGMMSVIGVIPLLAQAPNAVLKGIEFAIVNLQNGDPAAAANKLMAGMATAANLTANFGGNIVKGLVVNTPKAIANAIRPPAPTTPSLVTAVEEAAAPTTASTMALKVSAPKAIEASPGAPSGAIAPAVNSVVAQGEKVANTAADIADESPATTVADAGEKADKPSTTRVKKDRPVRSALKKVRDQLKKAVPAKKAEKPNTKTAKDRAPSSDSASAKSGSGDGE